MSTIQILANGPISINVDGIAYVPAGGPVVPPVEPPPGGGGNPGGVPPITAKPSPFADCGTSNGLPAQTQVGPNQVVGVSFTVLQQSYSRNLQWFGAPGQFFTACSWAIFDSGGGKVFGQDNTPYTSVDFAQFLQHLGAGPYTLAVATNGSGNLGIQWQQSPRE